MLGGLLVKRYAAPVLVASQNPLDATWRTADPTAYIDPDTVALHLLITCGESSLSDARGIIYYQLRPDSTARRSEVRWEVVKHSGQSNRVSSIETIKLGPGRTFDYRGYGQDSGDDEINIYIVGELKPAPKGWKSSRFDLVTVTTDNGLLLSGGTSATYATISPAGLPPHMRDIIGSFEHKFSADGSGWERSYLYLRPESGGPTISDIITANGYANGHCKATILQTLFGGDFDYRITKETAALTPIANIFAHYAVVPAGHTGGYALGEWTPDAAPVNLLSGGTSATWANVAVTGANPGDLAVLYVSATESLGAVKSEFGVDIREITPGDNHQPYTIRAADTFDSGAYSIRDTVIVRVGVNGIQYKAVNSEVTIELLERIGRTF